MEWRKVGHARNVPQVCMVLKLEGRPKIWRVYTNAARGNFQRRLDYRETMIAFLVARENFLIQEKHKLHPVFVRIAKQDIG
jgi:hypothetical protein